MKLRENGLLSHFINTAYVLRSVLPELVVAATSAIPYKLDVPWFVQEPVPCALPERPSVVRADEGPHTVHQTPDVLYIQSPGASIVSEEDIAVCPLTGYQVPVNFVLFVNEPKLPVVLAFVNDTFRSKLSGLLYTTRFAILIFVNMGVSDSVVEAIFRIWEH